MQVPIRRWLVSISSVALLIGAAAAQAPPDAKRAPRVRFVENAGQFPAEVLFSGHGSGLDLFVTRDGFVTRVVEGVTDPPRSEAEGAFLPRVHGGTRWHATAVRARLAGAGGAARVEGIGGTGGTFQYFKGNDPARWVRGARVFDSFVVLEWAPGVSARFRDESGILTYDWILAPGTPASAVALEFEGARGVALGADGALELSTDMGVLRHTAPQCYEGEIGGKPLTSRFALLESGRVGFEVVGRDPSKALVIDPGIVYATFIGGAGNDQVNDVASDSAGNGYFTGYTFASNYPTTMGSFDPLKNGGADAFLTKLAADGSSLVYSTFLGGDGTDQGMSLVVDALDRAHVVGATLSPTFPTTMNAYDKAYATGSQTGDGFLAKFSADGKNLVYSTYLGGTLDDICLRVALDVNGEDDKNVVVTGWTRSIDFVNSITAPTAFDNTFNGYTTELGDAFVVKIDKSGGSLLYGSLFGGPEGDAGGGVGVGPGGIIYVTGIARTGFPVKGTNFQANKGQGDAFVAAINPMLSGNASLLYSNLFGGFLLDYGQRLVVDASPAVYITGFTLSPDFPKVVGSYDTIFGGQGDAFVLKMNTAGNQLGYATYIGGTGPDAASSLAVDAAGAAYVAGRTRSFNFPVTPGSFAGKPGGKFDGFVAKLAPAGNKLLTAAYFGGVNDDEVLGLALVAPNVVWIGGTTFSQNLPFTPDAFDSTIFQQDGFVAKVDLGPVPLLCMDSGAPLYINHIVGDPTLPTATRSVSNCGSPESVLNFHVSEVPFVPWMSQNLSAGSIVQGAGPTPVFLDFDPTGLPEGAVNALLQFENDDTPSNLVSVPVVFTVQEDLSEPFVPGDTLTGAIDFEGEFDKGTFQGIKGMRLPLTVKTETGNVILGIFLVDGTGKTLKKYTVNFSAKAQKRTIPIPSDGEFTLLLRGNPTKAGALTSGAYTIGTGLLLPADAKPYSKKNQAPPAGVGKTLDRKRRMIAGSTLDVTVEPTTAFTGPLGIELLDPAGVPIDVAAFTQPFGVDGVQLTQVPIDASGLYTVRVTGLASPKERVTLTITPTPPVGAGAVSLP